MKVAPSDFEDMAKKNLNSEEDWKYFVRQPIVKLNHLNSEEDWKNCFKRRNSLETGILNSEEDWKIKKNIISSNWAPVA